MHLTLGRPIAVKVLARHLMDNPTAQARFRREARVASKLEHPNSVQSSGYAFQIVLSAAALLAAIAVGASVAWVIAQRLAQAPTAALR